MRNKYLVRILDAEGAEAARIITHDPKFSFEQYGRNRNTVGFNYVSDPIIDESSTNDSSETPSPLIMS